MGRLGKWALGAFLVLLTLKAGAAARQPQFGPLLGGAAGPQSHFRVDARLDPPDYLPGSHPVIDVVFTCDPDTYVDYETIRVDLVEARRPPGFEIWTLALPEPKTRQVPELGGKVRYLDGTFTAQVELALDGRAPLGEYGVPLQVLFTGCGAGFCELGDVQRTVRLVISGDAPRRPTPDLRPASAPAGPVKEESGGGSFAGLGPVAAVAVAFVAGLALALTPCVYPLIPVVVGLVGATASGRKLDAFLRSLVYVLGISITYSAAGTAAAMTGDLFGEWAGHRAVLLGLGAVFVLLAGAMFDLYAIEAASPRLGRLQNAVRGRWGLLGVLVVGLLSGAAATACIAPVILGALVYVAERGSVLLGLFVFFAMAWGMGAPLVVLGTFSGLAGSLPKAGAWMAWVKRAFGIVLLAAGAWYLEGSGLLPSVPYPLVVGLALVAVAVALGAFRVRGPEAGEGRRARGVLAFALLACGVAVLVRPALAAAQEGGGGPSINWLDSSEEALDQARREGKAALVYYRADNCADCVAMSAATYADPAVIAESRRFVCAKVDANALTRAQGRAARERYGLRGTPTTVLVPSGPRGPEFDRMKVREEFQSAAILLRLMRAIE